jgi:c-di-GMP-binding flagellar brake protein YcgR
MQSKPLFERKVRQFREANPRNPAARKVGPLRQRLGYGFGNNRNPFVDTRMLAPGLKLQCRISTPKRQVSFLTALVAAGEDTFWIRPPTAKGKPVSLERLPELGFRVTRENDAEYEFTCRVVGQAPDGMRAVALAHTDQIHRMFFRNAPRIPLDLPAAFYVVRQEFSQEKSAAALKVRDSQFLVEGRVKDLSSGGALAMVPHAQQAPEAGDMLIFKLAPAQIKDDIVAEVLRLVPRDDGNLQLHLQFAGLKELDRLKLNKYLTNLTQQGVAPVESGPRPS